MPLYDYECHNCGTISDVWAKMDEQEKLCSCGEWMTRLISAPNIAPDWEPYFDENLAAPHCDGQMVMSRQDRIEKMGRLGLTNEWGEGRKQRWV